MDSGKCLASECKKGLCGFRSRDEYLLGHLLWQSVIRCLTAQPDSHLFYRTRTGDEIEIVDQGSRWSDDERHSNRATCGDIVARKSERAPPVSFLPQSVPSRAHSCRREWAASPATESDGATQNRRRMHSMHGAWSAESPDASFSKSSRSSVLNSLSQPRKTTTTPNPASYQTPQSPPEHPTACSCLHAFSTSALLRMQSLPVLL